MTLADGRELTYDTYGDPDGLPVLFNHGFADSRIIRNPDEQLTASLGVYMIAVDQPGVGGSTPSPGRRMVDWGADMEQLADHLGLGGFAVAGHSGGAPHALATALRLPERVTHGALASPVGPFDERGLAKLVLNRDLRLVIRMRRLPRVIRWAYDREVAKAGRDMGAFIAEMAEDDPSDAHTFLFDPAQRRMFEQNFTTGIEQGSEGLCEMTAALWDWGFAIEDVHQHFHVFYGDSDDIVDAEMSRRVAQRLPSCSEDVWPGAGHYGFVDRDRWTQFLGALAYRRG